MRVKFLLPDGRAFRQFSMPGIPRKGETVLYGGNDYKVAQVAWDMEEEANGSVVVVILKAGK